MSNYYDEDNYRDYQDYYEQGLEGEYKGDPPPGYESWAEWHYIHGDELPTDADYGIYADDYIPVESSTDEYVYDPNSDTYYCPRTHKRLTQRQLDAEAERETEKINALAARIEAQNRRRAESRKPKWDKNGMMKGNEAHQIRNSKESILKLAAEQGVHPDIFFRTDEDCSKWVQDYNTWLYKHPRFYTIYKYTCLSIGCLCIVIFFLVMLFGC